MAITYTWAVTGMKVTKVGTETDYVVQTYWTKTGTDENGNTGTFSGATPLDPNPDQTDFVPYDQLPDEQKRKDAIFKNIVAALAA